MFILVVFGIMILGCLLEERSIEGSKERKIGITFEVIGGCLFLLHMILKAFGV